MFVRNVARILAVSAILLLAACAETPLGSVASGSGLDTPVWDSPAN
jgi:hypothetical protein